MHQDSQQLLNIFHYFLLAKAGYVGRFIRRHAASIRTSSHRRAYGEPVAVVSWVMP
ncbi:hypothetical protein WQQ_22790 [Hydrocarboniphaga effusa AP103]|uniref:Uncharacterized protein n=1 Tax=Hydrocarboniphaga effusa AP103 TaxID=1172194 RepID=I7ZK57_9GAMM|nr:hypothetical protein WQQ_22790 [Hydrocarboniphaga effusa AP103]